MGGSELLRRESAIIDFRNRTGEEGNCNCSFPQNFVFLSFSDPFPFFVRSSESWISDHFLLRQMIHLPPLPESFACFLFFFLISVVGKGIIIMIVMIMMAISLLQSLHLRRHRRGKKNG
jgi:hypothetical protein